MSPATQTAFLSIIDANLDANMPFWVNTLLLVGIIIAMGGLTLWMTTHRDRRELWKYALPVIIVGVAGCIFSIVTAESTRTEARAGLQPDCEIFLNGVRAGEVTYLDKRSLMRVTTICGARDLLLAANTPQSNFSTE